MRADRRDLLVLALASIAAALVVAIVGALFCSGCGAVVFDELDLPEHDISPDDAGTPGDETPETPDTTDTGPDDAPDPSDHPEDAPDVAPEADSAPDEADPPEDASPDDSGPPEADSGPPCTFCGSGAAPWLTCIARYPIQIRAGYTYTVSGCADGVSPTFWDDHGYCSNIGGGRCPTGDGQYGTCIARSDGTIDVCVMALTAGEHSWCLSVTGGPCEEG